MRDGGPFQLNPTSAARPPGVNITWPIAVGPQTDYAAPASSTKLQSNARVLLYRITLLASTSAPRSVWTSVGRGSALQHADLGCSAPVEMLRRALRDLGSGSLPSLPLSPPSVVMGVEAVLHLCIPPSPPKRPHHMVRFPPHRITRFRQVMWFTHPTLGPSFP